MRGTTVVGARDRSDLRSRTTDCDRKRSIDEMRAVAQFGDFSRETCRSATRIFDRFRDSVDAMVPCATVNGLVHHDG